MIAPPEIGTLAYFCQCSIVDAFADRGRVVPLIEQRVAAAGPVVGALLEFNYLLLDHDQRPRPAQYRLVWESGPATEPEQWQTWSPATGVGRLRLVELPAAPNGSGHQPAHVLHHILHEEELGPKGDAIAERLPEGHVADDPDRRAPTHGAEGLAGRAANHEIEFP